MDLEQEFEGESLVAYPDPAWQGVPRTPENAATWGHPWTIGRGHTGPEVHEGLVWTKEQEAEAFAKDKAKAQAFIDEYVTQHLTPREDEAVRDFIFNLGGAAFKGSTLLKKINLGDFAGAAKEFDKWDHAAGKVVAGLLRRRQAETELFMKGMA